MARGEDEYVLFDLHTQYQRTHQNQHHNTGDSFHKNWNKNWKLQRFAGEFQDERLKKLCNELSVSPYCRKLIEAHEKEILLFKLEDGQGSDGGKYKFDPKSLTDLKDQSIELTFEDGITYEGFLQNPDKDKSSKKILHEWYCPGDGDRVDLSHDEVSKIFRNKTIRKYSPHRYNHVGSLSSSIPMREWRVIATHTFEKGIENRSFGLSKNRSFGLSKNSQTIVLNHCVRLHQDNSMSCTCQTTTRCHVPCSHILLVALKVLKLSYEELKTIMDKTLMSWRAQDLNDALVNLGLSRKRSRSFISPERTSVNAETDVEKCKRMKSKIREHIDFLFVTNGHKVEVLSKTLKNVEALLKDVLGGIPLTAVSKPLKATQPKQRGRGPYDFAKKKK